MADEGTIEIGDTTLDTPIGYTHDPKKLESSEYSIGGTLLTTRIVTAEDQPKSKYTFRIADIVNSKMLAIKAEVAKIGNIDYIDNLIIVERLSGNNSTLIFYTQRRMSAAALPLPIVELEGVDMDVEIDAGDPGLNKVFVQADIAGRARFKFNAGNTPPDANNNIMIQYEPKYYIRIPEDGFRYTGMIKNVANYSLICREV